MPAEAWVSLELRRDIFRSYSMCINVCVHIYIYICTNVQVDMSTTVRQHVDLVDCPVDLHLSLRSGFATACAYDSTVECGSNCLFKHSH